MLRCVVLFGLLAAIATFVSAQGSSSTTNSTRSESSSRPTSTSVPFFTIPNTFTPPATGPSPIPGSVYTISNGPYVSDQFTYTAALSTVSPTGNITNSEIPASRGGAGGSTGLNPDPTNLQTVGAKSAAGRNSIFSTTTTQIGSFVTIATLVGLVAGITTVL